MGASWYDVLGVAPEATDDEIRVAWRAATADLEPTDRRFDLYNQAAKVLLDPQARADYDDDLPAQATAGAAEVTDQEAAADDVTPDEAVPDGAAERSGAAASARGDRVVAGVEVTPGETAAGPRGIPTWVIGALAVALLAVTALASYITWFSTEEDQADDSAVREAQTVLENNFGDILTYRWDDLETAHQRASALLTPRYQCEFDRVWALVEKQATSVEPVVTTEVVRSGVSRVSDDDSRVEMVALIRNEVSNKAGDQGVGSLLLGVTMVERDGAWLVDEVDGLEGGEAAGGSDPCASADPSDDAS